VLADVVDHHEAEHGSGVDTAVRATAVEGGAALCKGEPGRRRLNAAD
jgi:hypothetical protein